MKMIISIIIPTLNEEKQIADCIESVTKNIYKLKAEVLVVDSGSKDKTINIVKNMPKVMLFRKPELIGCKYAILNFGASKASGDILFFLDADSQLPLHFDQHIKNCLSTPGTIAGAFDMQLIPAGIFLKIITLINKFRYRISKNFYGDQGLFIRKKDFIRSGGYPAKPLMESAYYCRKLKKMGKLKVISLPILTSSRRFIEGGVLKVFFKDVFLFVLFNFRIPINRFAKKYWQYNTKAER